MKAGQEAHVEGFLCDQHSVRPRSQKLPQFSQKPVPCHSMKFNFSYLSLLQEGIIEFIFMSKFITYIYKL